MRVVLPAFHIGSAQTSLLGEARGLISRGGGDAHPDLGKSWKGEAAQTKFFEI